jgi:hypothetical protein
MANRSDREVVTLAKYENITEPDGMGYQVRVVRKGVERSKYFSHNQYGGKRKALKAALAWRDEIREKYKEKAKRPVKSNTGLRGISRTTKFDKRRGITYVSYSVHFKDKKGHPNNKTFFVGDVDSITDKDEQKALRAAKKFRKAYEKGELYN